MLRGIITKVQEKGEEKIIADLTQKQLETIR